MHGERFRVFLSVVLSFVLSVSFSIVVLVVLLVLAGVVGAGGCTIQLDTTPPPGADAGADTIELTGCVPLAGVATRVTGRLDSFALADGRVLVVAGAATVAGKTDTFLFSAPSLDAPGSLGECLENAVVFPSQAVQPLIDLAGLDPGSNARPLAAISTPAGTYLYFTSVHADGLASDGIGVARWDGGLARFTAPVFLWTADRPSFGSGVGLDGAFVYAVGGRPGGFLAADMFVARVARDQLAVSGAYEYSQGGGTWSPDPDRAAPFAEGGTSPSLAFYPARARWLLAYATPLGTDVILRSGLGPAGPWSLPVTLGRCALPREDPGSFCAAVVLHPSLSSLPPPSIGAPDELVLSHGVATFGGPAPGVPDDAYATRLVRAPWPATLP